MKREDLRTEKGNEMNENLKTFEKLAADCHAAIDALTKAMTKPAPPFPEYERPTFPKDAFIAVELVEKELTADKVAFRITRQKEIRFREFQASNGISIFSVAYPEWLGGYILHTRGENTRRDADILRCSPYAWPKILSVLREFNEFKRKEAADQERKNSERATKIARLRDTIANQTANIEQLTNVALRLRRKSAGKQDIIADITRDRQAAERDLAALEAEGK
jgi:hypothetical protein